MAPAIDDQIAEALSGVKQATIQELNERIREQGLPDDFISTATDEALNQRIRRYISSHTNSDGLKDFESIERDGADGKKERVYVQLALLDKEEFRRLADEYIERAAYMCRKANSIVKKGNAMHSTKRQLPFPGFGTLGEGEKEVA